MSRRRGNPETTLQSACLGWLALHPALVPVAWRTNAGMAWAGQMKGKGSTRWLTRPYPVRMAPKGTSDIVGVLAGGRFLAVEVKLPGEKPTSDQLDFLSRVQAAGGVALVVSDVEELARDVERVTQPAVVTAEMTEDQVTLYREKWRKRHMGPHPK